MHLKTDYQSAYLATPVASDQPIPSPPLRKVSLDPELLQQAQAYPFLEQQVIVHCEIDPGSAWDPSLRIWPTTYLIPKGGTSKSKLLQAEHISFYPEWTPIKRLQVHRFTLIFEGLPQDCTTFDLVEEIPEPGGFEVPGITRLPSDIYSIRL